MEKATNRLKITDVTFRDGHQSSLATRMRTSDMEAIAGEMNKTGFHSMEVWGGATFDVPTRFLNEDPWDRPRILKKLMPDTPLQMLLRGQNLVGYRNYADDVVTAFVHHAAEVGIDIFRIFDAVNDERNFETSLKAVKECGKHAQLCLSYSLTEPKLGGPVYNIDYFVNKARILEEMGADSFCIKDMAGLISPDDAYKLISALKKAIKIPVQLHTHHTSGMGLMSCLKAIEAGVDIVDTALAPFALRTSLPPVEPIVVAMQGTPRDTGLNLPQLLTLGQYMESIAPKYREFLDSTRMSVIDTAVLMHQIPGGMTTNLVAQLREADAIDRIEEVYAELPKVRKELGYPPLVTPTSQIVGIQAVQNVLFGRYKMISDQIKDYCYGLYGKPPAPVDPEVQKKALKGYPRGEKPITTRAADMLEPELDKAKEATKDIAKGLEDVGHIVKMRHPPRAFQAGMPEPVVTGTRRRIAEHLERLGRFLETGGSVLIAGIPVWMVLQRMLSVGLGEHETGVVICRLRGEPAREAVDLRTELIGAMQYADDMSPSLANSDAPLLGPGLGQHSPPRSQRVGGATFGFEQQRQLPPVGQVLGLELDRALEELDRLDRHIMLPVDLT